MLSLWDLLMKNKDELPILKVSNKKEVLFWFWIIVPAIGGFSLLFYFIFPPAFLLEFTLALVSGIVFFLLASLHDDYVVISVFEDSILIDRPCRIFKRKFHVEFSNIERVELKRVYNPIITKEKKTFRMVLRLQSQHKIMLGKKLSELGDFEVIY